MLVLTTMLTSIANDLPETAEVKYIGNTTERFYRSGERGGGGGGFLSPDFF